MTDLESAQKTGYFKKKEVVLSLEISHVTLMSTVDFASKGL